MCVLGFWIILVLGAGEIQLHVEIDCMTSDELFERTWLDVKAKAETLCSDKNFSLDDKADATAKCLGSWLKYCRKNAEKYSELTIDHKRHLQWRLCKLRILDWLSYERIRGRDITESLDAMIEDNRNFESLISCELTLNDDQWMIDLDLTDSKDLEYAEDQLNEQIKGL